VKRIHCANAVQLDIIKKELAMLKAAKDWSHCVDYSGCCWAPWRGQDGVVLGKNYYLLMTCAECLLFNTTGALHAR